MKKLTFAFILMLTGMSVLNAQELKLPAPSSTQNLTQEFGLGSIKLTYSRPNIKGRKVFGGLVPYNQVWRTGANSATLISFTEEVKIEGNTVPAGDYSLFTIPGESEWTIILNKNVKQWGAYSYKPEEDFVKIKVKPSKATTKTETFTIQFADVLPTSCTLNLAWENTSVDVRLTTDIDAKVMASIDAAMKGDKKPYFQAATYYYETGKDIKKALEWVNAAEAADQKAPWIKYWKARIQLKAGDKKGAVETAQAGIKAAQDMKIDEYVKLNGNVLAEAKK